MGEPGDAQDDDVNGGQGAEHLAGDVDAEQAKHRDDCPRGQSPYPPLGRQPEVGGGQPGGGRAERPVQRHLQHVVRQQRHQRRGGAGDAAEPSGDEPINAPALVMCLLIAMCPVANRARITPITKKAAGMAVSPVTAYAVGITPAATVLRPSWA
jgi:hypothetical protein